jgi:hypothetical protein
MIFNFGEIFRTGKSAPAAWRTCGWSSGPAIAPEPASSGADLMNQFRP